MNRLESIAKQFDEIGSIALTAVLVDQKVTQWKLNGTYHVNAQKWGDRIEFLAVVAEIVAHLRYKNRDAWFLFLLFEYPDQFQEKTGARPFLYQEFGGDEKVGPIHAQIEKMVPDVVRLSARAARDLAEAGTDVKENADQELAALRSWQSPKGYKEDLPILSENAAVAYEILLKQPHHRGITGPELLKMMDDLGHGIENSALTGRIIPELKPYGIENAPKKGYRIPESRRPNNL